MKNLVTQFQKNHIDQICAEYLIYNYTINSDGSIDVIGHVDLSNSSLNKIPIKFNKVSGDFNCMRNNLKSLVNAPIQVGGSFSCRENKIKSLMGSPRTVGGNFICSDNKITDLNGAPGEIGGQFIAFHTNLKSTYSGETDIVSNGDIYINGNLALEKKITENLKHIKLILKYQRHFFIWNDDHTLNVDNFNDLLADINDGLE